MFSHTEEKNDEILDKKKNTTGYKGVAEDAEVLQW